MGSCKAILSADAPKSVSASPLPFRLLSLLGVDCLQYRGHVHKVDCHGVLVVLTGEVGFIAQVGDGVGIVRALRVALDASGNEGYESSQDVGVAN